MANLDVFAVLLVVAMHVRYVEIMIVQLVVIVLIRLLDTWFFSDSFRLLAVVIVPFVTGFTRWRVTACRLATTTATTTTTTATTATTRLSLIVSASITRRIGRFARRFRIKITSFRSSQLDLVGEWLVALITIFANVGNRAFGVRSAIITSASSSTSATAATTAATT